MSTTKFPIAIYNSNIDAVQVKELTLDELKLIVDDANDDNLWVYDSDDDVIESDEGGAVCVIANHANLHTVTKQKSEWSHRNARFIATFNPKLIRQLLDLIPND